MGDAEVEFATERACPADITWHVRAESRETSRQASSIKDETSTVDPFDEAQLSSRTSSESLCSDSSENTFPEVLSSSVMQSRM